MAVLSVMVFTYIYGTTSPATNCARRAVVSLGQGASSSDGDVAQRAALLAQQLRREIIEAEDELRVEVEHSKKFMMRGDGLRHDFRSSGWPRRRALMRGAADNEAALLKAMKEAEAAGLPDEFMEDALRTANALAVARAEVEDDFVRLEGGTTP